MSSSIKLTYFDLRGLGELPRLVLAAGGQEYTDERLPFSMNADGTFNKGDWDSRKSTFPYGQVPCLTVDGVQIAQSSAIVRYLARKLNLIGANEIEAALIDGAYETCKDLSKAAQTAKPEAIKALEFWSKGLPDALALIEKNIKGATFFAASNQMSYADIIIYYTLFSFDIENHDAVEKALAGAPKVKAIFEAVQKNEKIAAYLAKRKVTPF